jgi:hypothetical protein
MNELILAFFDAFAPLRLNPDIENWTKMHKNWANKPEIRRDWCVTTSQNWPQNRF